MDQTIKWINSLDLAGWNPDDSWKTDSLLPDEVIERFENIDVLIMSLRGRSCAELSCALQASTHHYSGEHDIYAISSHVMVFRVFDREELQDASVWTKLYTAAGGRNWQERRTASIVKWKHKS
ncbi:hypothetical protein PHYPSEUDO_000266 [Phytophthora pseudosyringae]|uniref:Uncharacterized protein n=1 Tax=Phytophthora pseudosyringae TaxID=221518 RepID=A0A8T1VYH2_9STRA|nr:hypothetical protein PHYPSEUDO_000266 [Phytophthora pseudosyringae]